MIHQVTVAKGANPETTRQALAMKYPGKVTVPHPRTPRLIHVEADEFAHEEIEALGGVEFCCSADESVRLSLLSQTLTPEQWALGSISNTGSEFLRSWTGYGQRIYTVDVGVNATLGEFDGRAQIIHDPQGVGGGFHGTVTAACAVGNVYGVAKDASLYNAVAFDPDGTDATTARINAALNAIADHVEDNPHSERDILSMSFGTTGLLSGNPFAATLDRLRDLGVTLIASSGNGDGTTGYDMAGLTNVWPAEDPDVIAVGAHDVSGARGGFSNYPANIYAPGVSCEVIDHNDAPRLGLNGTSLSAPWFAGAVACVAEAGYSDPAGFLMAAAQDVIAVPGGSGLRLWLDPNLPYSSEAVPTPPAFAADLDVDGGDAATTEYTFEADGGDPATVYSPNNVIEEVA